MKKQKKAYVIEVLFFFGTDYNWIHTELIKILEQNFHNETPGYKAHAKRILKEIKKNHKA